MFDYQDEIEPRMRGEWHGFIANEIGFEPITDGKGKGKGHACPICGGNDRAHFKEKDGRVFLFCRGACGNTNSTWGSNTCSTPEYLCMTAGGYDFPTLVERCAHWLGLEVERNVGKDNGGESSHSNTYQAEKTNIVPSSTYLEKRKTPLESILSASKLFDWHSIDYCKKNALCGDEGEFLAIPNSDGSANLLVPLFIETKTRLIMSGAAQIRADGAVSKHGSCDGSYATIYASNQNDSMSIFSTDYAMAWQLARQNNCKAFYSPSTSAFFKCDATHVCLNTSDIETIDRANAFYKQIPIYIIPKNYSKEHVIESFEFLTYNECQARVAEFEKESIGE